LGFSKAFHENEKKRNTMTTLKIQYFAITLMALLLAMARFPLLFLSVLQG